MSVTVHAAAGVRKIQVLGALDAANERDELRRLLALADPRPCEVSFYDARTLPAEVVGALVARLVAALPLKVYAYHGYLVHVLIRLGLPVTAVPIHSDGGRCGGIRAVAIGGSADSLDKILAIVEGLPAAAEGAGELTLFIVQHVLEDEENRLGRLLQVRTDYRVEMPQHLQTVRPGTLYVAPPGHHMKVAHGLIYLTRDRKVNFARPSIDVLFESVAWEYGEHAAGVLLCGYGRDGVHGLEVLREHHGCALVEDRGECGAKDMPDAAQAAGHYDHIFTVREITAFLAAAVSGGGVLPDAALMEQFLAALYERYGYDFRGYQRPTIERRLEKMERLLGRGSFFDLQQEILGDAESFEQFFLELSINVTAFFRHPEQYRLLRERVLPYLDSFPHIKIWVAGCSTGEEVYSLAILLDEAGMLEKSQIFATDINPHVLEEAKGGLFPRDKLAESEANYREAGGRGELADRFHDNGYHLRIDERYRSRLLFHHHSLAHDGVFNEFQLILCRNVLIYFHPDLQTRVMELYARSLHRDGFLMLGPSEGLVSGQGERFFKAEEGGGKLFRWR